MQRYLAAAPPGLLVTASLLWTMQALILTDTLVLPPVKPPIPINFGTTVVERPVTKDLPPERIVEPVELPPRVTQDHETYDGSPGLGLPAYRPGPVRTDLGRNLGIVPGDGPLVHLVRVQPAYPARAAAQGLEGFVTVRFDVTALGRAANASVVASSHRIFEAAALKAAAKFRFRPKVVDGVAVPVSGISYRFRFEMPD